MKYSEYDDYLDDQSEFEPAYWECKDCGNVFEEEVRKCPDCGGKMKAFYKKDLGEDRSELD